jgi:predicted transcriptional regulator
MFLWMTSWQNCIQLQVDAGLKELDEGKGIPHEEVERRMPRWLTK